MIGSPELQVLGGLELRVNGESIPLGGPKAQQLLSVLIVHRGNPVSADRLIEALWGDQPPKSATATVQSQISRLRAILPAEFAIALDSAGYRLDTPSDGVDSLCFEALMDRCRSLGAGESVPLLESALALWRGPAFGHNADLPEVHGEAVRLDELRLVATDEWAEARVASGDPASMVGELESLVTRHPLRERYWRLLMLALYRSGRQGEALRRADEFRNRLSENLGLDLPPEITELEALILADDPSLRQAVNPPAKRGVNKILAPQLLGITSFIGRELDVSTLSVALRDQPLITVTGAGGVGKTRLAMRVAAALMGEFDDGVTVVELGPLRDPAGAALVIAHALDIQQRQYRTLESTIEDHLAKRNCLLVLDNCEHVTDTIAPLVDRLRTSCPRLRILATSREPLGLAGEYVEVLDPLSLPAEDAVTAEEIRGSAAVELFVSRAAAATRGFTLVDDNAAVVVDICRRLDGLPLAVELAAARLRSMGIEALAERLNQRSELLGQTQRGADGRQRTLHDLVEWSYDLLDPLEKRVFEQLAVFAGGFDLSAAEAVCPIEGSATPTLGTLASLVEKSMVVFVDPGPPRYRLLEPLREFGLDRLRSDGILEEVEDRHLSWFVDLAERGAVGLDSADERSWSTALDRNLENFRAAHLTAIRRQDAHSALRLVACLYEFGFRRVIYEVETWADAATALPDSVGHPDRATALAVSAYGRFVRGDMDAAISIAREAIEGNELSETGLAERVLGNSYFYMEHIEEGLLWMDRMLDSARKADSKARIAHALYMSSVGATSIGDTIRGATLAGESKAAADSVGSPTSRAQSEYALGLALETSEADEALARLERASVVAAQAGNRWIEGFALTEVHWLRAKQGDYSTALIGYADVVDTWYRGGDWSNQWLSLRRVLAILIDLGAFEAATILHGSLTAVGAAHALPFEPEAAERLSANISQLRSLLGPAEFADAVRRGASMKDAEIVSFVKEQIAVLTSGDSSSVAADAE